MKYVQINSVPNGSTGRIMRKIHNERIEAGDESWMIWGRRDNADNNAEFKFGNKADFVCDVAKTYIDGKIGFHSKQSTQRLIAKLDKIKPDVVHLHNIHGYYVNIEMLFRWLKQSNCKVNWTLHDCWAFTGHCAYYMNEKCNQWKSGCTNTCPRLHKYPPTFNKKSCSWNYEQKKKLFTELSSDRVTLITPSKWLADEVNCSFLSKYRVQVSNNKIDTSIFKPTESDFIRTNNLSGKYIVLGVAFPWTILKGIDDFVNLSDNLSDECAIVMVGLNKGQLKALKRKISNVNFIGIEKTDSQAKLAEIYSAANVLFNPTKEDNYPTVNLESEACGTPVITYDVGGCKETIALKESKAVSGFEEAVKLIKKYSIEYIRGNKK